jgi:hypothetical protein
MIRTTIVGQVFNLRRIVNPPAPLDAPAVTSENRHHSLRLCCLVGQAVPPALAAVPRNGKRRASRLPRRGMRNRICEIVY